MKIIPKEDHLKIELSGTSEKEAKWFDKETILRVEVFNGVPVIIFVCQDPADSFFIHLNIAELIEQEPSTWMETDKLKLRFVFLNYQSRVIKEEEVVIYKGGTDRIKETFLFQQGLSSDQIEDAVNDLYETDYSKIDWMKFPN